MALLNISSPDDATIGDCETGSRFADAMPASLVLTGSDILDGAPIRSIFCPLCFVDGLPVLE